MKKRLFTLTMAAALAITSISSVSVFAASDSSKEITVNIGDQAPFFLFKVAEEKGFLEDAFKDDNVTFKSEIFANMGPAIIEAMASGDVDLSIVGTFPVVNANNNGNEIKILASGNYVEDGYHLVVTPGS